jgi:phosphoglycolate phosphatase
LMACNAGVSAIGVDWGYHTAEELLEAGANAIARDFPHLMTLLREGKAEAAA